MLLVRAVRAGRVYAYHQSLPFSLLKILDSYLVMADGTTKTEPKLYELEISQRPPRTWGQILHTLLFTIVFDLGCIMINAFQFTFLLPLKLLPFAPAQRVYEEGIRYSKGSFGTLIGKCVPFCCRGQRGLKSDHSAG